MLSFFPRDVLDEILNLIESVSEGFPSYSYRQFLRKQTLLGANLKCLREQILLGRKSFQIQFQNNKTLECCKHM